MPSVNEAAPIAIFDSGVGGLSVLAELQAELPHERFLYLADTAHVPYGSRSDEEIRLLTEASARWLHEQGAKALVVACNTASAYGLDHLRASFPDWPIVGLVPAIKPAAERTKSGAIGVMVTPATLRGSKLRDLITQWAAPRGVEVMLTTSPELVPLVERGEANSADARALLRELLRPLAEAKADQLVLGCTHYPFLAGSITREFKDTFALVDSGRAVARQTARVLSEAGTLVSVPMHCVSNSAASGAGTSTAGKGTVEFFVTGDPTAAQAIISRLWEGPAAGAGVLVRSAVGYQAEPR